MKNYLFALGALFVSLLFFVPVFASNELVGNWTLISYNGSSSGAVGTVTFDETTMYSKFCNNVVQRYVATSGALVASGVGMSTMMYCEGFPMTLETNFTIEKQATVLLSGMMLTITTDAKNMFVFEKEVPTICTLEYAPVCGTDGLTYGNACAAAAANMTVAYEGECTTTQTGSIEDTCIQKFDGCNTCTRMPGEDEWACTKMYCETPAASYCIATSDDEDTLVGNDVDPHGCLGSAGYSWSQSSLACVRIWENTGATALEVAYDFAFNQGMTTMGTITNFRADDSITRQEAAKMLVAYAEGAFDKSFVLTPVACTTPYNDEALFDPTLKEFISKACAHEMMKGSQGSFMPNGTLTKGQALAVLMRTADGWQEEQDTGDWWMPYVTKAKTAGYISFESTATFNDPISRGDLIKMAHTIYLNASVSK